MQRFTLQFVLSCTVCILWTHVLASSNETSFSASLKAVVRHKMHAALREAMAHHEMKNMHKGVVETNFNQSCAPKGKTTWIFTKDFYDQYSNDPWVKIIHMDGNRCYALPIKLLI